MAYLSEDEALRRKYSSLLILCGIEITCFSKHLLAIFNNNFTIDKQRRFLEIIGLSDDNPGQDAMADLLGPSVLLDKIAESGGISIMAHADTREGFLHSFCRAQGEQHAELNFRGRSLGRIVRSPNLHGIQIANELNRPKVQKLLKESDYLRPKDRELALLRFSDSHGNIEDGRYLGTSGRQLGTTYSMAKLSYISFQSLKMALCDASVRIMEEEPMFQYPQILGCAIKSAILCGAEQEAALFRFNPELNCIIGARGTGKSTLLEIIVNTLTVVDTLRRKWKANLIEERFLYAIVYVKFRNKVYALSNEPRIVRGYTDAISSDSIRKVYVKNSKNGFKTGTLPSEMKVLLTLGYRQRQIYEYYKNPNMILEIVDDFIRWKHQERYEKTVSQIKHNLKALKELLTAIHTGTGTHSFLERIDFNEALHDILRFRRIVSSAYAVLHKMRKDMSGELNRLLKGKVALTLSRRLAWDDLRALTEHLPARATRHAQRFYDYQGGR